MRNTSIAPTTSGNSQVLSWSLPRILPFSPAGARDGGPPPCYFILDSLSSHTRVRSSAGIGIAPVLVRGDGSRHERMQPAVTTNSWFAAKTLVFAEETGR